MCIVCKMTVNMDKQKDIAAKQMKKDLAKNVDRSRKAQLKAKMADKLAAQGKKDTGDPNYMSPNPFLLPKKEQNPKRMAKDKALMSCLSLPAVAKQICLTKIKASMPPYAPTAVVPNPAKYAGVFDIGEPIYINDLWTILTKTNGVLDVKKLKVVSKTSGAYSTYNVDFDKLLSRDGTILIPPKNVAFEMKLPDLDIKGVAR